MPDRRLTIFAAITLIGFIVVLLMVEAGVGIVRFDDYVATSFDHSHGWFALFSLRFTDVLSPPTDGLILAVVAVCLALRLRSVRPLLAALWAELITYTVVLGLKYGIDRGTPAGYTIPKGDFPSGHTATALVLLGTAVLLLWQGRRRHVGLGVVVAVGLLLGLCLIWDRFHWFSDVLASFLLAPALLWSISLTPSFRATVRRRVSGRQSPS